MALSCAAPASDAGLVQGLLTSVDCNVRGIVEVGYAALAAPGSQTTFLLTALMTLYVGVYGLRLMLGQAPLRVGDLTLTLVKIGIVLALATSWPTYQQLVFDTLFRGPEEIAGSVLVAIQAPNSIFRGNPFDGLQIAYDELQVQAAYFAQRSNSLTSPLTGGNAFGAFALNVSAFITLMTTLGVVLAVKIVLGLLLALGPVFVALLLFDATRGVFEGWLRAALAFAFAPLFVILALVVQLALIEPHLVRLAQLRAESLIDLAPAMAILTLTLITAGVSLAGLAAAGMIAGGLRFKTARPRAASTADAPASKGQGSVNTTADPVAAQQAERTRASAIASAAAAMDRRDLRIFAGGQDAPMRAAVAGWSGSAPSAASQPLGQTYRRPAQPRRAASSARRDR